MGIVVAGIQPGYLPWLGFFDQMQRADVFVIADELPFSTDGWTHRNRVRGPSGIHWLTVPTVRETRERILDVRIDPSSNWRRKHMTALTHFYGSAPQAPDVLAALEAALPASPRFLVDASIPLLHAIADMLGIRTRLVLSSEAGLERHFRERFGDDGSASERIVAYVQALGGDRLLEGETGAAYLDTELCRSHGVEVDFHHYDHPVYEQMHGGFVSHLSVVDLLLNAGPASARQVIGSIA